MSETDELIGRVSASSRELYVHTRVLRTYTLIAVLVLVTRMVECTVGDTTDAREAWWWTVSFALLGLLGLWLIRRGEKAHARADAIFDEIRKRAEADHE